MRSKRTYEGYLLVDHRDSPGITVEEAISVHSELAVGQGERLESPTYNCSHCERMVIMRPNRSRIRGYCRKCDRYLCDNCSLVAKVTGMCESMSKFTDDYLNAANKGESALAQVTLKKAIADARRASILKGVSSRGT